MQSQLARVVVIERRVETPSESIPWYLLIGGIGGTGAVFGGLAWAFFWLNYPQISSRMEIGRWMGGGSLLAGLGAIIYLVVKVIAKVVVN